MLETREIGWIDLAYGGPGMRKQRVLRWNGKTYQ